jgi:hypothetical protein
MGVLSRAPVVVNYSNIGIVGLKPARGIHVDDVFAFRVYGML